MDTIIYIDVSAQNGFGGATREIFLVTNDSQFAIASHQSPQTSLYVTESSAADSDSLIVRAKYDDVEQQEVYDLFDKYKQTGSQSQILCKRKIVQ